MTIVRCGYSARVKQNDKDRWNWTNDDFARLFLQWLVATYPIYRSGGVCVRDIRDHLFQRFQVDTGCHNLQLGSLLRGLGNVTTKSDEVPYVDATGRRRTMTEYDVPDAAIQRKRA